MSLKDDRQAILDYCGYTDWSVLVRKASRKILTTRTVDIWFRFHQAMEDVPLSEKFLYHYGPTIIDWHSVYWNKFISTETKEKFKERIFWYWVEYCFDRSVPKERRIELLTGFFESNFGLTLELVIKQREI